MRQQRLGDVDRLFTVGYEGRSLEGFIALLQVEGIEVLVDVRENPWSRKPGFTGSELGEALEAAGIAYEHMGELGAPRELRKGGAPTASGFEVGYRAHLAGQGDALDALAGRARERRTAIMCMEARPEDCHRRMIAERFEAAGWATVHLGV